MAATTSMFSFESLDTCDVEKYERADLMAARTYVCLLALSGKRGGFSPLAGRMVRETIGYKFDAMDVREVLKSMAQDDFLKTYGANVDRWAKGVRMDDSTTGHQNIAKHKAALALASDTIAFRRLVTALRILCQRNQSWVEKGNNLELPYNGHKAMLDLFGINVTTNRRLTLTAN